MKTLPNWMLLALLAGTGSSLAFAQGTHHHGNTDHDHAHDQAHQHEHGHGHGAAAGTELPQVEAEVRRVNTRANTLSARHGNIPNLDMPPMTMTLEVLDPAMLEGLNAGDNILITIDQIDGVYTVMSLEPAP